MATFLAEIPAWLLLVTAALATTTSATANNPSLTARDYPPSARPTVTLTLINDKLKTNQTASFRADRLVPLAGIYTPDKSPLVQNGNVISNRGSMNIPDVDWVCQLRTAKGDPQYPVITTFTQTFVDNKFGRDVDITNEGIYVSCGGLIGI